MASFYDAVMRDRSSSYGNQFGLNPSSNSFARDANAALLRSQYQDWSSRFRPIEDELLDSYNNPNVLNQSQEQGADLFQRGFTASQGAADRRLASYGLTLTPDQQASRDRQTDLAKGLGQVNAFNSTARDIKDRDTEMLTGLSGATRSQFNGGQS